MRLAQAAAIVLTLTAAAPAPLSLEQQVRSVLAEAGPGPRFGIVVVDETGKEIVAISPDDRFIPASNTKMFTTAAAFDSLAALDRPDDAGGTAVRVERRDVVLSGRGDARLSSAPDCTVDCLAMLADALRKNTRRVRDVIGDDSLFADERWSPGMSWNNIPSRSGTGISALTLDDNEGRLTVTPGVAGAMPTIASLGYFEVDNRATTVAAGQPTKLDIARMPMERRVRVIGTIAADEPPRELLLGIDDPAHYAAWRLAALLRERGVRVAGRILVRHQGEPGTAAQPDSARLSPPPLVEDIRTINKVSQNLHAELLLRRIGLARGNGSIASGQVAVTIMLDKARVPRRAYSFSDGSGMSTYNRVSPRGVVTFLRWTAAQPWGAAWRDTLPIGGVDGTLAKRFTGTPLAGKLFAKTGSINATNALAGFLTTASGRTLTFAAYANDVPEEVKATVTMDKALNLIAAAN